MSIADEIKKYLAEFTDDKEFSERINKEKCYGRAINRVGEPSINIAGHEVGELLRWAFEMGHENIVEFLLSCDEVSNNITAGKNAMLRWACRGGKREMVELALQNSDVAAEIARYDNQALAIAVAHGHLEVAAMLLENKEVEEQFNTRNNAIRLLSLACKCNRPEAVNFLLAKMNRTYASIICTLGLCNS